MVQTSSANPIASLALKLQMPTISDLDAVAQAGCMLSYGSDTYFPFERSAYFVDRLLNGASASDLPVERISKLSLTVNLKTAATLEPNRGSGTPTTSASMICG